MTAAVIFDMDGVILDSESVWEEVIRNLLGRYQRQWTASDQDDFLGGDNSLQWASYLRRKARLPLTDEQIVARVTGELQRRYEEFLPLIPGAEAAVNRLAAHYPLGLASSSPRRLVAYVLDKSGLSAHFRAWVSSDEVPRGKPHPDVYLEACRRMQMEPQRCVAVEDSSFGIRAAHAAGLAVVALPHPRYPLPENVLDLSSSVVHGLEDLTAELIERIGPPLDAEYPIRPGC